MMLFASLFLHLYSFLGVIPPPEYRVSSLCLNIILFSAKLKWVNQDCDCLMFALYSPSVRLYVTEEGD